MGMGMAAGVARSKSHFGLLLVVLVSDSFPRPIMRFYLYHPLNSIANAAIWYTKIQNYGAQKAQLHYRK
jgi:hypothetical protein